MIFKKNTPVNYIVADAILNDDIKITTNVKDDYSVGYSRDGEVCFDQVQLEEATNQRLQEDSEEDYSEQWGGF